LASQPKELFLENELDDDVIESRIGVHDSNHFEVKLDYGIRSQGRSRYNVDYYFFVPASLGVNKHTYRAEKFFSDVQAYIRFKTPGQSIASLIKGDCTLKRIRAHIKALRESPRNTNMLRDLSHELRIFGCVFRANVRDRVSALRSQLRNLSKDGDNHVLRSDIGSISQSLTTDIETCLEAWRELRPDFADGRLPASSNETFAYVDEFIGLVVEQKLAALLRRIDGVEGKLGDDLSAARHSAKEILLRQRKYSQQAGYPSVAGEHDNDHFVYRRGALKKFVMSVLWLDISKQKEGKRAANVGAAIAAGAAMFFALIATIYAGDVYGINSWNFIVAGVFTYILKDRIKDWLKIFFGASFSRFLADYSIRIRDPITDKSIGRCRENFDFIKAEDLPKKVLQYRRKDAKASIEYMTKPEVIMHYSKRINLQDKDIVERMHLKDYNLNDIVRFSLAQFMVRADDPTASIPYYVEETDAVERRVLSSKESGREQLKRVRVIFDKEAIRELQEVE
jgi:hypothetical protein